MLILKNFTNKVQNWTLTKFFDHLGGGRGIQEIDGVIVQKLGLSCFKFRSNLTSLRKKKTYIYFLFPGLRTLDPPLSPQLTLVVVDI